MNCPPQGAAMGRFLRGVAESLVLGGQIRQLPGNQRAILSQLLQLLGSEIKH